MACQTEQMKKCSKCDVLKNTSQFNKDSSKPEGLYSSCKECCNARMNVVKIVSSTKICSKCSLEKCKNNFGKDRFKKDGLRHICKSCEKNYALKFKDRNKAWYSSYYVKNRYKIIKRTVTRIKFRYATDPLFRLSQNVSHSIYGSLKGIFKNSSYDVFDSLGYSVEDLKLHIESLWEPWMNWGNHGKYVLGGAKVWHIDHIIPKAKLPFSTLTDENFKRLWALSNLRPLEAKLNISKGSR